MPVLDPASLPDEPGPELSAPRVLLAMLIVAAIGAGGFFGVRQVVDSEASDGFTARATWFAPYVDTTLTPTYAFQSHKANPARDIVLGFVVADRDNDCRPSWGTHHSLDGAATALDLDRRVAQVRGRGGDALISFGGQANTELAVSCRSRSNLTAAYRSVAKRYSADTLDFDIEGTALADTAANKRRAKAVKTLQDEARSRKNHLAIWLTLPVTPNGLQGNALSVIRAMLAQRVDLAGVNIMAMDYGGSDSKGRNMLKAAISASNATHNQLSAVFGRAGVRLNSSSVWNKVGVTVMIGQNDVDGERFSVGQARELTGFAKKHKLGRLSMWSLNRDSRCGATFAVVGEHSNVCSGVAQRSLQFSKTFAKLRGAARASAKMPTSRDAIPLATTSTVDDPDKSPYPIWNARKGYKANSKVVWHQAVYSAKYYSQGQTPDTPPADGAEPWLLIGPVLRGDRSAKPKVRKLPAGTYPAWSPGWAYVAGNRVLYDGRPFEAKSYTIRTAPGEKALDGSATPWKRVSVPHR